MVLSKLPKWSWAGFAALAFTAGMINAVALLGFSHQAATHVTGLFSHLTIHLYDHDFAAALNFAEIIFSFFCGAFLCGLIIRDTHFQVGRRYGFALALEALLLFASAWAFSRGWYAGMAAASVAAGLQNALVSHFSGAVVRTTHMTGILTDLGVLLGNRIMRRGDPAKKARVFLLPMASFILGGFAGTFGFRLAGYNVMYGAAMIVGLLALGYQGLLVFSRPQDIPSKKI